MKPLPRYEVCSRGNSDGICYLLEPYDFWNKLDEAESAAARQNAANELVEKMQWTRNDLFYKAPEQLKGVDWQHMYTKLLDEAYRILNGETK